MSQGLAKSFRDLGAYASTGYGLLPFRFLQAGDGRYILTNWAGEFLTLNKKVFGQLVEKTLPFGGTDYNALKARHFIYDGEPSLALDLLATKYRTKQAGLAEFTSLHIFVVTLRCDHSCQYCQVSRVSEDRAAFDMTQDTADRAIDLAFKSPSRCLKFEFQGGEPLLNFDLIRHVVEKVSNRAHGRNVQFVITTNLAFLTPEIIAFARQHQIKFSCSLDGPPELHNHNRPRHERDSHQRTIAGIQALRGELGWDSVSALMTTTAESLDQPEQIIDEYVKHQFGSIFLRWVSPFGFAVRAATWIGYDTERFLEFYKRGLDYILQLNRKGCAIRELYSAIILRKILTPYATSYVDLQSPAGLGLGVIVYNYDGDVYASDEGRMLAEMGDCSFRLGNVHHNTYEQLFLESPVLEMILDTVVEGLPGCSECAFSPYCGTDPVFNHATQGNVIGHRPTSAFCRRNMAVIQHLIDILESGDERARILKSWAQ